MRTKKQEDTTSASIPSIPGPFKFRRKKKNRKTKTGFLVTERCNDERYLTFLLRIGKVTEEELLDLADAGILDEGIVSKAIGVAKLPFKLAWKGVKAPFRLAKKLVKGAASKAGLAARFATGR